MFSAYFHNAIYDAMYSEYGVIVSRYDTNSPQHYSYYNVLYIYDINYSIYDILFNFIVYCIQHQHIMSDDGFIKCEYINIIGKTVVNRTCCEHPLLGAANLLCEAT